MDNLNTHAIASLYQTFPAEKAGQLAKRLEIHYTPKHGNWLYMAEISAWESGHSNLHTPIDWQFTTDDARIVLKHLYHNV